MSENNEEVEEKIVRRLRALLDLGLDKHDDRTLAEIIKDLARVVVQEEMAKIAEKVKE